MIHIIFLHKSDKWLVMSNTTIYGSWSSLLEAKREKKRIELRDF